jgi:hypothetical protein
VSAGERKSLSISPDRSGTSRGVERLRYRSTTSSARCAPGARRNLTPVAQPAPLTALNRFLKPKFIPSGAAAANKIPNMTIRIPEDGRIIV